MYVYLLAMQNSNVISLAIQVDKITNNAFNALYYNKTSQVQYNTLLIDTVWSFERESLDLEIQIFRRVEGVFGEERAGR